MTQTAQGILLMICAVMCFSLMDVCVKALDGRIDPSVAVWVRYFGQTALVLILVRKRLRSVMHTHFPFSQAARGLCLTAGTALFYISITALPLTFVTGLMQTGPVLISIGAAVFLGEHLGPRRWAAVLVAMVGALIILRPGMGVFDPMALLPILGMVCVATYTLLTRHIGNREDAATSMLYTALVALGFATVVVPFRGSIPPSETWPLLFLIAGFGSAAQFSLIQALMRAEASLLAPYSYLGMLFATIWGLTFFSERPDVATLVGAVVIIGAGLYVWHRERRTVNHE